MRRLCSRYSQASSLLYGSGIFSEEFDCPNFTITQRLYAHRTMPQLLVMEVELLRHQVAPLSIHLSRQRWLQSPDVTFEKKPSGKPYVS